MLNTHEENTEKDIDQKATEYRKQVDHQIFALSRKDMSPEVRSNGMARLVLEAYKRGAHTHNPRYVTFLLTRDGRALISAVSHRYDDCEGLQNAMSAPAYAKSSRKIIELSGAIVDSLGICQFCERRRIGNKH